MKRLPMSLRQIIEVTILTVLSWALLSNVQSNWARGPLAIFENSPLFFSRCLVLMFATLLVLNSFKGKRAAKFAYLGIVLPLALWIPTCAMLINPAYDTSQPFQCYYRNRSEEDVYVKAVGHLPASRGRTGEKRKGYSKPINVVWWKGSNKTPPQDPAEVHRVTVFCPKSFKYGDALVLILNDDGDWFRELSPRGELTTVPIDDQHAMNRIEN